MTKLINNLDKWDKKIFLELNQLRSPWLDPVMDWLSSSHVPIFVILGLIAVFGWRAFGKKVGWLILLALMNFGATDAISSKIFKPYFERFRPCHSPELEGLWQTVGRCWGGKYGFVSSHAANSFGIALLLWFVFRKRYPWFGLMIPYAALVSYTRIYLAKHYPGDLIAGALLGAACAWIFYTIWKRFVLRRRPGPDPQ